MHIRAEIGGKQIPPFRTMYENPLIAMFSDKKLSDSVFRTEFCHKSEVILLSLALCRKTGVYRTVMRQLIVNRCYKYDLIP